MVNLNCGDKAIIEAEGPDSKSAIAALAKLVSEFSDEGLKYGWDRYICFEEDYQIERDDKVTNRSSSSPAIKRAPAASVLDRNSCPESSKSAL